MAQMKREEGSGGSEGWREELELGARLLTVEKKKKRENRERPIVEFTSSQFRSSCLESKLYVSRTRS